MRSTEFSYKIISLPPTGGNFAICGLLPPTARGRRTFFSPKAKMQTKPCCGDRYLPCLSKGFVSYRPLPLTRVASPATGGAPLVPPSGAPKYGIGFCLSHIFCYLRDSAIFAFGELNLRPKLNWLIYIRMRICRSISVS